MMEPIQIINYEPVHQPFFERFNRQWIEELFVMEPVDEWMVTHPEKAIIEPGGAILMAEYNGVVAGTVGLRKASENSYELIKMAVDNNFRRKGIAEALSYASFRKAKAMGATNVILYSNKRNAEAVKLYEKVGFRHVQVEAGVYKRADVKMIMDIETAIRSADKYDQLVQL